LVHEESSKYEVHSKSYGINFMYSCLALILEDYLHILPNIFRMLLLKMIVGTQGAIKSSQQYYTVIP